MGDRSTLGQMCWLPVKGLAIGRWWFKVTGNLRNIINQPFLTGFLVQSKTKCIE